MFDDEDYEAFTQDMSIRPINGEWYYPEEFIHKLAEMMNRGDSPIIAITGDTNTGKSWTALRLAATLYDDVNLFAGDFVVEDNFLFEPLPFVKKMRDIPVPDGDINPHREIVAIDEAGALLNKFDFNDTFNRSVDKIFQTMRIKNSLYMLMLPDIGDLDSSIRDDIDFMIEMLQPGLAKITDVRKLRNRVDGKNVMLTYNWGIWNVRKPPEDYIEQFDSVERGAKQDIVEEIYDDLKEEKEEEERKSRSLF